MNIIIINKKEHEAKHLAKLIRLFCLNVSVVGFARNTEEGIDLIHTIDPDLIFMDSDILNEKGHSYFFSFQHKKFQSVFIVNADQTELITAIQDHELDYLVNPVNPEALIRSVENARLQLRSKLYPEFTAKKKGNFDRIGIPTSMGVKYISLDEIIYLKADNNYTEIIREEGRSLLISKALKSFEKLLPSSFFSRVHQSYLVNLEKVVELQRKNCWQLVLKNNFIIPISRSKKDAIKQKLELRWMMI